MVAQPLHRPPAGMHWPRMHVNPSEQAGCRAKSHGAVQRGPSSNPLHVAPDPRAAQSHGNRHGPHGMGEPGPPPPSISPLMGEMVSVASGDPSSPRSVPPSRRPTTPSNRSPSDSQPAPAATIQANTHAWARIGAIASLLRSVREVKKPGPREPEGPPMWARFSHPQYTALVARHQRALDRQRRRQNCAPHRRPSATNSGVALTHRPRLELELRAEKPECRTGAPTESITLTLPEGRLRPQHRSRRAHARR